MGKTKNKNHKPDEFLLQQVRHLRKELKRRDQRIKQLEKDLRFKPTPKEVKPILDLSPICQNCGKGCLREIIIVDRKIITCDTCFWRSKAQKI